MFPLLISVVLPSISGLSAGCRTHNRASITAWPIILLTVVVFHLALAPSRLDFFLFSRAETGEFLSEENGSNGGEQLRKEEGCQRSFVSWREYVLAATILLGRSSASYSERIHQVLPAKGALCGRRSLKKSVAAKSPPKRLHPPKSPPPKKYPPPKKPKPPPPSPPKRSPPPKKLPPPLKKSPPPTRPPRPPPPSPPSPPPEPPSPPSPPSPPPPTYDLWLSALKMANHTTVASLFETTGIYLTLTSDISTGNTILAPTNAAFSALPAKVSALLSNPKTKEVAASGLLQYQILNEYLPLDTLLSRVNVTGNAQIDTLLGFEQVNATFSAPASVEFYGVPPQGYPSAKIVTSDFYQDGFVVIQIVDHVLVPDIASLS